MSGPRRPRLVRADRCCQDWSPPAARRSRARNASRAGRRSSTATAGHWPALLARFPRLFRRPSEDDPWDDDWPVVPPESLEQYPVLAADLTVWREQLEPRFRQLDHRAQILQNQFWRQRVALIAGGLVATSLATVQAAMGGGNVDLAVLQAVLTGLLAGLTVLIRSRRAQHGYLSARLKAERIKSEFFLFLARAGAYADGDRADQASAARSTISRRRRASHERARPGVPAVLRRAPDQGPARVLHRGGSTNSTGRPARACSSPPRSSASRPAPARWPARPLGWAKRMGGRGGHPVRGIDGAGRLPRAVRLRTAVQDLR